jgi:hypothetical protein
LGQVNAPASYHRRQIRLALDTLQVGFGYATGH